MSVDRTTFGVGHLPITPYHPFMPTDPRIDAYIAAAPDFARPILTHLRRLIHRAAPGVQEALKWRFPNFTLNGKILCSMAAFKEHCSFGFWSQTLRDELQAEAKTAERALGNFGRITALSDLPPTATLTALIKRAVALTTAPRARTAAAPRPRKPVPKAPADFRAALSKNPKALAAFREFPPSHKREYIEWITAAKRPETRAKRIAIAVPQIAQRKPHNWQYMSK